jgi:hypothetical protein
MNLTYTINNNVNRFSSLFFLHTETDSENTKNNNKINLQLHQGV